MSQRDGIEASPGSNGCEMEDVARLRLGNDLARLLLSPRHEHLELGAMRPLSAELEHH
jgi:hypothetical protein